MKVGDSEFEEMSRAQYGYGLTCQLYRGERTVSHTGSLPGWGSLLSVMPDREIGVVVLTNRDPCPVRELITYMVFDRLCSLSPIDWFDIFHARRESALEKEEAEAWRFDTTGIVATYPDELLNHFIGEYSEPAYGTISITYDRSGVCWRWRGLQGRLLYRGEHSLQLKEDEPARLSDLVFTFDRHANGVVTRLRSQLNPAVSDIVFQRLPKNGVAHTILNNGDAPLIMISARTNLEQDICEYPRMKKRLYMNGSEEALVDFDDVRSAPPA